MSVNERMPWKEICDRYPEQWVVMVDHNWDDDSSSKPKTARVLATGATCAEAKERARPLLAANDRWGCHFTGPIRGPVFGYRPWLLLP